MNFREVRLFSDMLSNLKIRGYLVGGAVRDIIMNRQPKDFDFMIEADWVEHRRICEAISMELGCEYDYNELYRTAKFYYDGSEVDFVMSRSEVYKEPGGKPIVEPAPIHVDLKRRDFSINAMAIKLFDDLEIVDPLGGMGDLRAGIVRVLHNKSFEDDPTRLFRGIKYASRFGFQFEKETEELILNELKNGCLNYLKKDRIKNEIISLMSDENPIVAIKFLEKYNVLSSLIGRKVKFNFLMDKDKFLKAQDNIKLVSIFFDNPKVVIEGIQRELNIGKDFLRIAFIIGKILDIIKTGNDDDLYSSLIRNNNPLVIKCLEVVSFDDDRINNFLINHDKINIKEDIENIKMEPCEILKKKISILKNYGKVGN